MRCEGPGLRGRAQLSRRSGKQSREVAKSRLTLRFMWKGNATRIAGGRTSGEGLRLGAVPRTVKARRQSPGLFCFEQLRGDAKGGR
jgi:hypothetical protein